MYRSSGVFVCLATGSMLLMSAASGLAGIDEIIVTAERREQSVQSIPGAITALTREQLELQGIDSASTLQFGVPGVFVGEQPTQTSIIIRGVGPTPQGLSGVSSVAVSVDGVNQSRTVAMGFAQIDLERAEIARGPQGTLYGRNATGGAINFITKAPTDSFEAEVSAGYAEYNELHAQGILNLPIGNRVRTRLVVDYKNRENGFIENIRPGGEDVDETRNLGARARIAVDLTDNLELEVGLSTLTIKHTGHYFSQLGTPNAAALAASPVLATATFYPGQSRVVSDNDINRNTRDYDAASATLTWDLPIGTLKSITAYQRYKNDTIFDGDGVDISISTGKGINLNKTFSQELTFAGSTKSLDWVVGAFYSDEEDENEFSLVFGVPLGFFPPNSTLDFFQPDYSQKSYAAFADVTYSLNEKIDLIAGVRHTEDKLSATYSSEAGAIIFGTKIKFADLCPPTTDEPEFSSTTPRAGIQYNINSDQMAYFKYSRGYKAGGVNVFACDNDYDSEEVVSYEVGYKSTLFDGSLIFNASAFHYDYSDFQVAQLVNSTLITTNASSAVVNGVELESVWAPDEHWLVNASYAYIDAHYKEFFNLDGLNAAAGIQDLSGNLLNGSPKNSLNFGLSYTSNTYGWGHLTAAVNTSYRSRTFFREFELIEDSQKPFSLTNVNLIWNSPSEKYQARLYAKNITDEDYYQSIAAADVIGSRTANWAPPRQVGFKMTARLFK